MLIIAFLAAALSLVSSAPALPPTIDPYVAATAPPMIFGRELPECVNTAQCRSVQDIIWGCLATIFACAWVAIHPNVPRPEDSGWLRFKQRVVILIYGILTPEFIIMWALRQRIGAAENMRAYNKKFHPSVAPFSRSVWWHIKRWFCGPKGEKSGELWNLTHGFLIEMRGLVDHQGEVVIFVGKIPDALAIPNDDISDKSKGDFLTKTLVLAQTTWFTFQCLARWITHLPVTELEVITFAFALLNTGTYILWWNKPQNMTVPIQMSWYQKQTVVQEKEEEIEANGKHAHGGETPLMGEQGTSLGDEQGSSVARGLIGLAQSAGESGHQRLGQKSQLEDQSHQRFAFIARSAAVIKQCILGLPTLAIAVIMAFRPHHLLSLAVRYMWYLGRAPLVPLVTMASFFPDEKNAYDRIFYCSVYTDREVSIWLSIIGTLFGGMHLVPIWLSSFPSSHEMYMWRISACLITGAPSVFAFLIFIDAKTTDRSLVSFDGPLSLGIMGLYLLARTVLVILAFTTLHKLPPGAFRNIAWATFLPHL